MGGVYLELLSPDLYREIVKPIHMKYYTYFGDGAILTDGRVINFFKEFMDYPIKLIRFTGWAIDPLEAKDAIGDKKIILVGVRCSSASSVATKNGLTRRWK